MNNGRAIIFYICFDYPFSGPMYHETIRRIYKFYQYGNF